MKSVAICFVLTVCVAGSLAQVMPPGFNNMMGGLGAMMRDIQSRSMGLAQQGQGMFADSLRSINHMRQFGPGQRTFTTHDGGHGVAYTSPDGTFSSFSMTSGGPSSGFMFYRGPDGQWQRSW